MAWNPGGFHLIEILPKKMKFDNTFYVNNILQSFAE
jgi:hypothetical protein